MSIKNVLILTNKKSEKTWQKKKRGFRIGPNSKLQDWKSLDLSPPEPSSDPLVDDTQVTPGRGFQASFGQRSGEMTLLQNLGALATQGL